MQVLTVCNQKGGTGKTTTAFHLIAAAARHGLRVLAIDLDPQGNLTAALAAVPLDRDALGIADVLSRAGEPIASVLTSTIWPGVTLAPSPSSDALTVVRDELLLTPAGRETRLADALRRLDGFDLVVIDTSPAVDQLTVNALVAAHLAVIVSQTQRGSLDGIAHLTATIDAIRQHYNPALRTAIIANGYQAQTRSDPQWLRDLTDYAEASGTPLLTPPIPHRVVIRHAYEASTSLSDWPEAHASDLARLYDKHLTTLMKEARH